MVIKDREEQFIYVMVSGFSPWSFRTGEAIHALLELPAAPNGHQEHLVMPRGPVALSANGRYGFKHVKVRPW